MDNEKSSFDPFFRFIHQKIGLDFYDNNSNTVISCIKSRMSHFNQEAITYLQKLKTDKAEQELFFNLITVNETYFFREEKQFKILKNHLLPKLLLKKDFINAWSVTCSTGEEAISIALLLDEMTSFISKDFKVYASDLNSNALATFKKGEYYQNSFRKDGSFFHNLLKRDNFEQSWSIPDRIRDKIEVLHSNLFDSPNLNLPDFDIIFFRNTLIYMQPDVKQKAINAVLQKLNDEGFLFLGSAEIAHIKHPDIKSTGMDEAYFFHKVPKKVEFPPEKTVKESLQVRKKLTRNIIKKSAEFDLNLVLDLANQNLSNTENSNDKNPKESAYAKSLLEVFSFINSSQIQKAKEALQNLRENNFINEITAYLSGRISMMENQINQALSSFRQALSFNPRFWLAHFHLALLLKEKSLNQAYNEFQICRDKIKESQKNYTFLLDHFNENYFIQICNHWIKQLKEKL